MCRVRETGASGPTRDVFVKPSRLKGLSGRAGRETVKSREDCLPDTAGLTLTRTQRDHSSMEKAGMGSCYMGSQH